MKFSKKMIMIPEAEYGALLNLFSGGDHLKVEKGVTEARMSKVIRNPRLSELEKGKKYDLLYKKRRQLKKMIDDRPQKVIIESEASQSLPTSGVVPAQVSPTNLQQIQQHSINRVRATKARKPTFAHAQTANTRITRKAARKRPPAKEQVHENNAERAVEDEISDAQTYNSPILAKTQQALHHHTATTSKKHSTSIRPNIINIKHLSPLKKFVNKNRDRLGITPEGKIFRNMKDKNPVKDSDINSALSYMAGGKVSVTPGILYLYQRLSKEPEIREMIQSSGKAKLISPKGQKGKGGKKISKKYIIEKINPYAKKTYKTKGIPRGNKLNPKLWVKLGI
jgi:hypothetical protein